MRITERNPARRNPQNPLIVVSNVFADDNRGGAAITARTIDIVRDAFPTASTCAVTVGDSDLRRSHRFLNRRHPEVELLPPLIRVSRGALGGARAALRSLLVLLLPRFSRSYGIRTCLEASLVIGKGGYVFVDRGGVRGLLSLWLTSFPLVLAARQHIPTVVFATTIGPFRHRSSRAATRWILRRIQLVLPRDRRSFAEAMSLGLDSSHVIEIPDVVLGMEPPTPDAIVAMTDRMGLTGSRFAVVTVQRGPVPTSDHEGFTADLARAIQELLAARLVDGIAVVVQVDGTTSDLAESMRLVEAVDDTRVALVREDLSPEELTALYGGAAVAICGRLHSAIFSLVSGTPAFVIATYRGKAEGVFESLALGRYVIPYPRFDVRGLMAGITDVIENAADARWEITAAVDSARVAGSQAPELLRELVSRAGVPIGTSRRRMTTIRGNREAYRRVHW